MALQPNLYRRCASTRPVLEIMCRTTVVRTATTMLVIAMLAACGGGSAGPKDGVHNKGGKDAFNVSLVAEDVIVDVTVDPAQVGDVMIHMEFAPPGGKLQQVQSVTGNLVPGDPALSVLVLWFEKSGANHFHDEVKVPTPGEWTLELDAVLADGTAVLYTTKVTISS